MKYLGHFLTLSLLTLPAWANYPDEINFPHYQSIYQSHSDDLARLNSRYQNLDRDTRNLYADIQRLQMTFNNYSNEIININNSIRNLSNESRNLTNQRSRLANEERSLNQQVNRARSDYDRLKRDVDNEARRIAPIRNEINQVEAVLRRAQSDHSSEQGRLRNAQNGLSRAQSNLSRVRSDISRLEGTPNRTPAQQSTLNNLHRQRSSLESEISRMSSQVRQHQTVVSQLAQTISGRERQLRSLNTQYDREVQRLRQLENNLAQVQRQYNDLSNRLRNTRTSLTNTERRLSSIRSEVTRFESRKRDIERDQQNLRFQIDSSQRRYSLQVSELEGLGRDVERQRSIVTDAQFEFEKRQTLYNKFLVDAQNTGRSQVRTASERGNSQGEQDAKRKGYSLGKDIGKSLGTASGNLWGAVRAEVIAYHEGYETGYNLPRTDAQNAADKDAAKAAKVYVENVLRPTYFEEVVQAEIKKPFFVQKRLEVPSRMSFEFTRVDTNLEITDAELLASDRLVTNYDDVINQFKKEKIARDQDHEHSRNALNSYEQQENYPYDKVDCSQVYKGVRDFIVACEEQFHSSYRARFEESAYESYKDSFSDYFSEAFEATFNEVVQKQYEISYDKTFEVVKMYGKEEGRRVMYDEAYELQYKVSYANHLASEKNRVRSEVVGELAEFLEKNPLLTMTELKGPEEIIAGDTFKISSLIRNLGKNKAGLGHLNIVKISGAEIVTNKVTTPEIKARSQSEVLGPEVRVQEDLMTGKKVVVEVEATLPGDNYKSSRVEKLVFERTVSVSPIQELKLNVDNSPSVRNILRRFLIHTLSADVSPKFEDLRSDLDVNLVALRGGEHVEFKVSTQKVARMKKGDKRNIKFSYVFKDSAKGQSIVMALQFLYKGRVVQTEQVELKPH